MAWFLPARSFRPQVPSDSRQVLRRFMLVMLLLGVMVSAAVGRVGMAQEKDSAPPQDESADAAAYKPGDRVVLKQRSPLVVPKKVVGEVPKGVVLSVLAVNKQWIWVQTGHAGWLDEKYVLPLGEAEAFFSDEIKRNNKDASAYASRGHTLRHLGQYDKAIADYDEAIRLQPKDTFTIKNRAFAKYLSGDFAAAIADYDLALKINAEDSVALNDRGHNYYLLKNYAKALADYDAALRLDPKHALTLNNRAWLLATCPDASLRNGAQAVDNAERACELSGQKNFDYLDTLAAAYAESGDYARAAEKASLAAKMASEEDRPPIQRRLAQYQKQQPYHGHELADK